MTPVKSRSELGRSNLSKGKRWMADLTEWLRGHGFPGAEVIAQNSRADLAGLLEWTAECKDTLDDGTGQQSKLGTVMNKLLEDQAARETRWHVLLKKRRGDSTENGYAIMTIRQWAEIAGLLDEEGDA